MPASVHWTERAWIGLLQVAPLKTYTRLIRMVSGIPLPRPLREPVFGRIALRMGIDLGEAAGTVAEYRRFQDLFVRPLRDGSRPLDMSSDAVISPVDGRVNGSGHAEHGGMIQAKRIEYPLARLVASQELARKLEGGQYLSLYLRPRDYHRIHCPITGRLTGLQRVGGTLFPVQPSVVRGLEGLYVRNERVVFELDGPLGPLAMVCVAAAGVGTISTVFDGQAGSTNGERKALDLPVVKGQELARFNLGSTVILVFSSGRVELAPLGGQPVRMGQRVATVVQGDRGPVGD